MRKVLYLVVIVSAALVATGCQSISYKPAVALGTSPQTIKANVKIETFVDQSPPSDKSTKTFGISACEPTTLQGELAADVTDAVLMDFNNNQVFDSVKKRVDGQPDLILKGVIHRFYGTSGPNAVFWATLPVDIVWFFGLPIEKNQGAVDLEICLERPNGSVLGTYHGQAQFSDSYSMYHDAQLALPTPLNNAFSQTVAQIREQIMKDGAKLVPARAAAK